MRIFETFLLAGIAASGLYSQTDWPGYGGDPGGQRYSGLSQINTKNVSKLKLACSMASIPAPSTSTPPTAC